MGLCLTTVCVLLAVLSSIFLIENQTVAKNENKTNNAMLHLIDNNIITIIIVIIIILVIF